MKEHARAIFDAAVQAADPVRAMRENLAHWAVDAGQYRNIFVVGAGKAAARMAAEAERKLGSRITAGAVNTKYGMRGSTCDASPWMSAGTPCPMRQACGVRSVLRNWRRLRVRMIWFSA